MFVTTYHYNATQGEEIRGNLPPWALASVCQMCGAIGSYLCENVCTHVPLISFHVGNTLINEMFSRRKKLKVMLVFHKKLTPTIKALTFLFFVTVENFKS